MEIVRSSTKVDEKFEFSGNFTKDFVGDPKADKLLVWNPCSLILRNWWMLPMTLNFSQNLYSAVIKKHTLDAKSGEGYGGEEESEGEGEGGKEESKGKGDGEEEGSKGKGDGEEEGSKGKGDGAEKTEGKGDGGQEESRGKGESGEERDGGEAEGGEDEESGEEIDGKGGSEMWSIYRVTPDQINHRIASICPLSYANIDSVNDEIGNVVEKLGDLSPKYPTPDIVEYTIKYGYLAEETIVASTYAEIRKVKMAYDEFVETFRFVLVYDPTDEDEVEFQNTVKRVRSSNPSDFDDED